MLRLFSALAALLLSTPAVAALDVSATVPSVAAIAKELGGEHVQVRSLSLPTQDPHFVDAKPSLALELSRTDLVLAIGLELEIGWLPNLITGARNPKIQTGGRGYLDLSRHVKLLDVASAPINRSQGDIHPGGNPHYLYDPRAAAGVAKAITARFSELDPKNAGDYQKRLETFLQALEKKRVEWETRLAPVKGAHVLTYHQSLSYLADWLGLKVIAALEPKPGIPPNPAHLARVLSSARKANVRMIIQEEYYPNATSRQVAQRIPAPLVEIPGGTDFRSGQTYLQHLDVIGERLGKALAQEAK